MSAKTIPVPPQVQAAFEAETSGKSKTIAKQQLPEATKEEFDILEKLTKNKPITLKNAALITKFLFMLPGQKKNNDTTYFYLRLFYSDGSRLKSAALKIQSKGMWSHSGPHLFVKRDKTGTILPSTGEPKYYFHAAVKYGPPDMKYVIDLYDARVRDLAFANQTAWMPAKISDRSEFDIFLNGIEAPADEKKERVFVDSYYRPKKKEQHEEYMGLSIKVDEGKYAPTCRQRTPINQLEPASIDSFMDKKKEHEWTVTYILEKLCWKPQKLSVNWKCKDLVCDGEKCVKQPEELIEEEEPTQHEHHEKPQGDDENSPPAIIEEPSTGGGADAEHPKEPTEKKRKTTE